MKAKTIKFPVQKVSRSRNVDEVINRMRLELPAISANESFARSTVAAFASALDPTLQELDDIKTAVSEAVTNCVVHAYQAKGQNDLITIACELYPNRLVVRISDSGMGIKDVTNAMQPFVTSKPDDERSGMGFTVMQSFMDELSVESNEGKGTMVTMLKLFKDKSTKESAKVCEV